MLSQQALSVEISKAQSLHITTLVQPWAERAGVIGESLQRYLTALSEISDAIAELAIKLGIKGNLDVSVQAFVGWVTVEYRFPREVPLDPHFDVRERELDALPGLVVQPDIFWRRLVLEWVDKAQWAQKGKQVTIALSQYARRGPSAKTLYFLELKPRRQARLEVRQTENGNAIGFIPDLGAAFRLSPEAAFLLAAADGHTSVRDIYRSFVQEFGLVDPAVIGTLIEDCTEKGLIIAGDELTTRPGKSSFGAILRRITSLRLPVKNSFAFFNFTNRRLGWLWSMPALWLAVAFVLASIALLLVHPLRSSIYDVIYGPQGLPLASLPWFIVGIYGSTFIHELSHGMACTRLGGRVDEFGIMFYCGMFCAYVDTTSAWMFPRRLQRFLVSFAGPLASLVAGSVFLWADLAAYQAGLDNASIVLEPLAFVSIIVGLINMLPVLELDGYYMLVDLFDIPNLKQQAIKFWLGLVKPDQAAADLTKGKKILFIAYGLGSVAIILLMVGWPALHAFELAATGQMTPGAWLALGAVILFLTQLFIKAGHRWFNWSKAETINLK